MNSLKQVGILKAFLNTHEIRNSKKKKKKKKSLFCIHQHGFMGLLILQKLRLLHKRI